MKCALAVLALLTFAGFSRADSVQVDGWPLYYPAGATVTGTTTNAFPNTYPDVLGLYYSFADGTGQTYDPQSDGDVGYVDFATDITAVTFNYVWDGTSPFQVTFFNSVGFPFETLTSSAFGGTDSFSFTQNVSKMQWVGQDESWGIGGITSLSYVLDGPISTPEPDTLLLTALGLALVGAAFAWRGTGVRSSLS